MARISPLLCGAIHAVLNPGMSSQINGVTPAWNTSNVLMNQAFILNDPSFF